MNEIIVVVKPFSDVVDGTLAKEDSWNGKIRIEHCSNCGSPLMYVRIEYDYEGERGADDYSFYCAVCGQCQGGHVLPSPFPLDEEDEPKEKVLNPT